VFTLTVSAPGGTSGDIAVPVGTARVEVRVDGRLAWDGTHTRGFGAQLDNGYVTLHGIHPGTHTVTVRVADR
jgi:hypothetical protein